MPTRLALLIYFAAALASGAASRAWAAPEAPAPAAAAAQDDEMRLLELAQKLAANAPLQTESAAAPALAVPAQVPLPPPVAHTPAPAQPEVKPLPESAPAEQLPLGPARKSTPVSSGAGQGTEGGGSWALKTLAALGVVIGLILLLRAGVSKISGRSPAAATHPAVEVLSRVSVAPRNHVLLVRIGRRILVLGDSAQGLSTLADLDDPEEVAAVLQQITASKPQSISRGFAQMLGGLHVQYEEDGAPGEPGGAGEHHLGRTRDEVSGLLARVRAMSGRGGGAA